MQLWLKLYYIFHKHYFCIIIFFYFLNSLSYSLKKKIIKTLPTFFYLSFLIFQTLLFFKKRFQLIIFIIFLYSKTYYIHLICFTQWFFANFFISIFLLNFISYLFFQMLFHIELFSMISSQQLMSSIYEFMTSAHELMISLHDFNNVSNILFFPYICSNFIKLFPFTFHFY